MTDLVEQLRDLHRRFGHLVDLEISNGWEKAATALEAKDKELAALRERVANLVADRDTLASWAKKEEARAETAERERDEAREALKPFADIAGDYDDGWLDNESHWDDSRITVGHLRAARAITGEKQ